MEGLITSLRFYFAFAPSLTMDLNVPSVPEKQNIMRAGRVCVIVPHYPSAAATSDSTDDD